ncbi:hypothetical protein EVAR_66534_1 [Eumeta japonica]|uniref:Uncharacterized protein n=1 Tax=Eumeta variegata TaxID=151549 RepID=A0A4C1ZCV8_EUMVA|nr:hypothetical protein EVAR_66534_1 [Eumeta japonica]
MTATEPSLSYGRRLRVREQRFCRLLRPLTHWKIHNSEAVTSHSHSVDGASDSGIRPDGPAHFGYERTGTREVHTKIIFGVHRRTALGLSAGGGGGPRRSGGKPTLICPGGKDVTPLIAGTRDIRPSAATAPSRVAYHSAGRFL